MWNSEQHDQIVKTLAVVCEVTGTQVSPAAAQLMVHRLDAYPAFAVLAALKRCADECKYRLSLADIIERIDDGRPNAEVAWATFPKSEEEAGVVTAEMLAAWGAARRAYADGDKVGARMAFKEAYERELRAARDEGREVEWSITAGWDKLATEGAAIEAMQRGLLTADRALQLVDPDRHDAALQAAGLPMRQLAGPHDEGAVAMLAAAVKQIGERGMA